MTADDVAWVINRLVYRNIEYVRGGAITPILTRMAWETKSVIGEDLIVSFCDQMTSINSQLPLETLKEAHLPIFGVTVSRWIVDRSEKW